MTENERTKPILPGTAATDYERYLRTDELLSLQKTAGDVVHHDEHLFQAVHQVSEIWLKLACTEIEAATAVVVADGVGAAVRLLRRANDCMRLITDQLLMLEHMNPVDYAVVRTALGHGAGFDSPGFRRVHHVSPPLGHAFDTLLARRGISLIDVYRSGYAHEDLYQLAEALITWDEHNILWRTQHLKTVERIIGGHVIGTQGTPVEVLGKRLDVRFFPDLWTVRDDITRQSPLGADGHGSK
jgi:tryptophan 2,3-dioxygenase